MCTIESHAKAKLDLAWWQALPLLGVNVFDADELGPAERIESRNCPHCESTLAKVVP